MGKWVLWLCHLHSSLLSFLLHWLAPMLCLLSLLGDALPHHWALHPSWDFLITLSYLSSLDYLAFCSDDMSFLTTVFILLHVILLAQLTLSMWCELVSSLSSLSSEGSLICLCAIVLCAFCPLLSVEYQEVWEDLQPLHFGLVLSECCWWYTFKSKNSAEALTEFAHWNTYIVHLHDLSLWSHVFLTCAFVPLSFIYCCIDFVM